MRTARRRCRSRCQGRSHSSRQRRRRNSRRVLVPGGGLGRLACEICARGYACQGHEFSYFMLLSSSFVLNDVGSERPRSVTIYPWADQSNNVFHADDTSRSVYFIYRCCCSRATSHACQVCARGALLAVIG